MELSPAGQVKIPPHRIPAASVYPGPGGALAFATRRYADYLGLESDHPLRLGVETGVVWDTHLQLLQPDDHASSRQVGEAILNTGTAGQGAFRIRAANGVHCWFLSCVERCRASDGTVNGFIGINLDIEDRKRVEDTLRRSEQSFVEAQRLNHDRIRVQEAELRQILDLAPQIIGVLGPGRERLYASRFALDYYGVGLEEWRGRTSADEVHPDDVARLNTLLDRSVNEHADCELEVRLRKADGTHRWFLVRHHPLRNDQGQLIRWYLACTDIDDRKTAEDRLLEENVALREEIAQTSMFEDIVGTSPALTAALSRVSRVAASDSTVLVTGETGTGKELVARAT